MSNDPLKTFILARTAIEESRLKQQGKKTGETAPTPQKTDKLSQNPVMGKAS